MALLPVPDVLEEAAAAVGIEEPLCRDAGTVERGDGQGEMPWSGLLSERRLRAPSGVVETAAHMAIVVLSGMRHSELRKMNLGCRIPDRDRPGAEEVRAGEPGHQGKPLGGVPDESVVIREAYQAAEVAEQLLHPDAQRGWATAIVTCGFLALADLLPLLSSLLRFLVSPRSFRHESGTARRPCHGPSMRTTGTRSLRSAGPVS